LLLAFIVVQLVCREMKGHFAIEHLSDFVGIPPLLVLRGIHADE
jgi:hypothetical protein